MAEVSRPKAMGVALLVAAFVGYRVYVHETLAGGSGGDIVYYRNAALALLDGRNPYHTGLLQFYPLPAVLVFLPIAKLSAVLCAAIFAAAGALALTYGLLRVKGWPGLAMLASPSFFLGWYYLQWSPLLVASAFLPWLGGFGAAKPNVALAPFAYRPDWRPIAGGMLLVLLSFLLWPTWVTDWIDQLRQQTTRHIMVLAWPFGVVGLTGLLRWRTPEGRALAAMTLPPLNPQYYDHLGVWLVARTWQESLALSVTGWIGFLSFVATAPHNLVTNPTPAYLSVTLGVYLPAAIIVARHVRQDRSEVQARALADLEQTA